MSRAALILSVAVAALVPAAAAAGVRQDSTVLMSENKGAREFQEKWGYADAVVAGDTIFLSGIVAGKAPGEDGFEPAYERVYRQIGAILKRAGASWDDVVDLTSFHTDVEGQIEAMPRSKSGM